MRAPGQQVGLVALLVLAASLVAAQDSSPRSAYRIETTKAASPDSSQDVVAIAVRGDRLAQMPSPVYGLRRERLGDSDSLSWMVHAHPAPTETIVVRREGRAPSTTLPDYTPTIEVGNVVSGWTVVAHPPRGATSVAVEFVNNNVTYAVCLVTRVQEGYRIVASEVLISPQASSAFLDWKVSAIDDEGVALWWQLAPKVSGHLALIRGPAGHAPLSDLRLEGTPQVGAIPGVDGWQIVATMTGETLGFRDFGAPLGESAYQLAILLRIAIAPGRYEWRSVEISPAVLATRARPLEAPVAISVSVPENDNGTHLKVSWKVEAEEGVFFVVLRGEPSAGLPVYDIENSSWSTGWVAVGGEPLAADADEYQDTVEGTGPYRYAVAAVRVGDDGIAAAAVSSTSAEVRPSADWFNESRWGTLTVIFLMVAGLGYYIPRVRKNPKSFFIRRIAGVDAIEDAIGRSTEMGRPVLYVTGTENIQNIQTIASLLSLGHVAEMTAEYDTELKVANFEALTMVVAEEIVRQGYANAGRADAHRPENSMFISSEQFAFAAGVNGIILRDKPATNIYLGRFFAESLILAETGYVTKSIQIAGTAEVTQLPFFIAACDYTIIGEELYAVSAYLSRDPKLIATLKATDAVKLLIIIVIVLGALEATLGLGDFFSFGS